jgi:hypothetical protein
MNSQKGLDSKPSSSFFGKFIQKNSKIVNDIDKKLINAVNGCICQMNWT